MHGLRDLFSFQSSIVFALFIPPFFQNLTLSCRFSSSQDFLPVGESIGDFFGSHYCLFYLVAVIFFFWNTLLLAFNHNILSLSCGLLYPLSYPPPPSPPLIACPTTKQTLQWRIKPTAESLNEAFFQEYEC